MEEKTPRLQSLMEILRKPGFSVLGHGTRPENAKKIMESGLKARSNDLSQTAIPLDEDILSGKWPHRDYKSVVVIQIPNPAEDQSGGVAHFNSVFDELSPDEKVEVGIQGVDRSYVIPKEFIQGVINVETMELEENPNFNPPTRIEKKLPPQVTLQVSKQQKETREALRDIDEDDWLF